MIVPGNNGLRQLPRTVFLDRDGVINRKPPEGEYVRNWSEFELLPGAAGAIFALHQHGIRVLVVSNQRGIALGLYSKADVEEIQNQLAQELARHGARIDGFYYCPHDEDECNCRKPLPGLFEQARRDFPAIDAGNSLMIGDSLSDIEFGRRLGMPTIFIECESVRQKSGAEEARMLATATAASLPDAVRMLFESAKG